MSEHAIYCPACERILGTTDIAAGNLQLYCRRCRAWHRIDLAAGAPRRRDAQAGVRLLGGRGEGVG